MIEQPTCFYCGRITKKRPGHAAVVCVPCKRGLDAVMDGNECEHEEVDTITERCKSCNMRFVACGPCTEAACGAGIAVIHEAPECDESDLDNHHSETGRW